MDSFEKNNLSNDTILYLFQVKNMKCFNTLLEAYKKESISSSSNFSYIFRIIKLFRKRQYPWNIIKNKTMLSGNDPTSLSKEQLILYEENKNIYAFDYNDIEYLCKHHKNPFTKDTLNINFIYNLYMLKKDKRYNIKLYTLEQALYGITHLDTWCPSKYNTDPKIVYLESLTVPEKFDKDKYNVVSNYKLFSWTHDYVYRLKLKEGVEFKDTYGEILAKNIESYELIHDPWKKSSKSKGEIYMNDKKLIQAIKDYHNSKSYNYRIISPSLYSLFDEWKVKENKPIKIYRGLFNATFLKNVKLGDIFDLESDKTSSWTHNMCVAVKYASWGVSNGVVVSAVINPEDIIIDSMFLSDKLYKEQNTTWDIDHFTAIFHPYQDEVLVKPGKHKVIIEKIIRSEDYTERRARDDLTFGWNY